MILEVSFYPGPSQVDARIPSYVKDAFNEGVLSANHRSAQFETMCRTTVRLLRQKLSIPKDFTILFTSSATECWEILAQSLVTTASIHVYNGAFGEKWFSYVKKLKPASTGFSFAPEGLPEIADFSAATGDMICLTQNETSNGTQLSNAFIKSVKKNNPDKLIAVDAVSSMAGIYLDFKNADIWFASVQKCFGLPAGLGVMAISPRGMERIRKVNESAHYNSLTLMDEMMQKWQTSYTPNVMAIYLLMRVLSVRPGIREVHRRTLARFEKWQTFFHDSPAMTLFVSNRRMRSHTVLTVRMDADSIPRLKTALKKKGFLLGSGYGSLKKETFRIANFPALKESQVKGLMAALKPFL